MTLSITPTPTHTPTPTPTPTWTPTTPAPGGPNITVTPSSITVTLPQDQSTTVPLTLRNAGNAPLTFAVGEEAAAASALASTSASTSRPPAFPTRKVDPALLTALDAAPDGQATFLVYLDEQADLSGAESIHDWTARGEFVVRQLQETAARTQAAVLAELGGAGDVRSFWIVNAIAVTAGRNTVDALAARPDVAYLELAPVVQIPEPIEEAPAIAPQGVEWGVSKIGADRVWRDFGVNGAGIVVANIDTGVDSTHPALVGKYRGTATGSHDYNWYDPTGTYPTKPGDNNGHGTHTMGIMAGDDGGSNQIGVAPGAQWIAAKGCASSSCAGTDLLKAAQWILAPCPVGVAPGGAGCDAGKRPHVVNNSWGGSGGDPWYFASVQAWRAAGIFPAFAAGNSGGDGCAATMGSPGDYSESFASGATDSGDVIAWFSSRGPSRLTAETKPDVTAPGYNVRSAIPGGSYKNYSGTSMASPHTAGVVALILAANSSLDVTEIESLLMSTAADLGAAGPDCNYGYGRIDAYVAVAQANDVIPWLSAQPTGGSIAAGGEQVVTLTLNAAGLDVRAYTANLVITSNDPDTNRLVVPVTLNVTSAGPQIARVRVSNRRDVSASISWITTLAADGEVRYGTNPAALSDIAYDDRGAGTRDDVHHITIGGLAPLTTYWFYVRSDGVADVNAGSYYSLTTGASLGVPGADPIYGQVFKQDGVTPAANVLVYVQALDNNGAGSPGESGLLTALTDASGWWYDIKGGGSLNLASMRTKDGSAYFAYSASGDAVRIEAEGGSDCRRTLQADTGADSPAPPLTLSCLAMMTLDIGRYRSVFVWPLPPAEALTSEQLLDEITMQGGNAVQLDRWQPQLGGWGGHPHNVPFGDFATAPQTPYFMKATKRSLLQVAPGAGVVQSSSITLTLGWNFIALPWDVQLHAAEACAQIPAQGGACSDIARWSDDLQDWAIKPCSAPFGDFLMTPADGYFIKSQAASVWMPEPGMMQAVQTSPDAKDCFGPNDGPRNDEASGSSFTWEASIRDVRIANRRDASLTFTWLTDLPATGYVRYGVDPAALLAAAADDRGANTVAATHHVTLRSLAPETTYYAVLISGQTVDDNGGQFYQATTGPMLSIPAADPAYGRVLLADGVTPAAGALVYVTLQDADGRGGAGEAALLSAVADDAGYWSVNLGGIRAADGRSYFAYSGKDRLALRVHRAVGQQTAAALPVAGAAPAPTVALPSVRMLYLPLVTRP